MVSSSLPTTTTCTALRLHQTQRFSTIGRFEGERLNVTLLPPSGSNKSLPILPLTDLLLHEHRSSTSSVRDRLIKQLQKHSYCILTTPNNSRPACIISSLRKSIENDFFPYQCNDDSAALPTSASSKNRGNLQTSSTLYISERGIPMWKLGYELCEDQVREVFRLHAGDPDSHEVWPSVNARQDWLRGLALCRHICDQALDLVFENGSIGNGNNDSNGKSADVGMSIPRKRNRAGLGGKTWLSDAYCTSNEGMLKQRPGDFSVLYTMHYFNPNNENALRPPTMDRSNTKSSTDDDVIINVKQHVDPSLFVLEPFLAEAEGLQVWDTHWKQWVTCDGSTSPIHSFLDDGGEHQQHAMILFVGKAFCEHFPSVSPTLHRVIGASQRRRTVIYEQKYEEFFPPPMFD